MKAGWWLAPLAAGLALAPASASAAPQSGTEAERGEIRAEGAETPAPPSPRPTRGLRPPDAPPLSPAEERALEDMERVLDRYREVADKHHERVGEILYREYEERRSRLDERYEQSLEIAGLEKRRRHEDAIAQLEQFLARYPDHQQYTPDAMFRLATLYLDRAEREFDASFDERSVAADDPNDDSPSDAPLDAPDYSEALAMWRETITRFPDYRQKPATLYLLGYYLNQIGRDRESLAVYRGLVCANHFDPNVDPPPRPTREEVQSMMREEAKAAWEDPYAGCEGIGDDPKLIQEGWVRGVGDIHFNTPGELNEAISAYERVARNEDSEYYDEALYKLAWSYYRNDDYLKGITAFDQSVKYSDQIVAEGGEPLELRPEAIQYIAVSFTDPWSIEEQPDPQRSFDRAYEYYEGRFDEPHVRDVFVKLGETFKILEAHQQAIDSYRLALSNDPLHPENPVVHQELVSSLEALGDRDAADAEAARLASTYQPGTEWYAVNETDREAMDNVRRISERMLRAAAENRHRAAQVARQEYDADPTPEAEERYIALYREAAELYQRFIDEYPTASEVYEFTYRLGETRFFAGDYLAAAEHYRWVRDHRELSEERFEEAALSLAQSYEREIQRRIEAGELPDPGSPTVEELRAMGLPVEPMQIPDLYRRQQRALDTYQRLVSDPQTAPEMGLHAALISYRFLDLDDAADRFEAVMDRFCGDPEAAQAKDGLLAIYEARGQDQRFEATNQRFIEARCGNEEAIQLARAQNRSKQFRDAKALFDAERYDAAAEAFYTYYKRAPEDDEDRPVALYNAAIAYDRSGKPRTAIYLFEELTDNDNPLFRQSEYYLHALYLTAASYQQAFDYDQAVRTYLRTVEAASEPDRPEPPGERSLEEIRLDALYNAAVLRELDRVYDDPQGAPGTGAVSLYRRYAELEENRRESDRALWAVARVYGSAQEPRNASRAFTRWREEYGRDEGNEDDYVFSFYRPAELYAQRGNQSAANRYRRQTVEAWEEVGSPEGTSAADMAAEHAFHFAERQYDRRFEPYTIDRVPASEQAAERVLDELDSLTTDVRANYDEIGKFQSGFWGLAAKVRVGDTLFYSGQKLLQAPPPRQLVRLDQQNPERQILLRYEEQLETNLVEPKQQAARQQWEQVVNAAQRNGVSNEWTELALQRLHDFISQEDYPVLRAPIVEGTEEP